MFKINLSQMAACVEESRVAWLDADRARRSLSITPS